jgi:SNF2 family DNA or RNA helicase
LRVFRGLTFAFDFLGKTLQTAAFVDILQSKFNVNGPVLIIAPLSTLAHWQREFQNWTDLNAIIYHGSAEDRTLAREHEFAYPEDRPKSVAFNRTYLKRCGPKNYTKRNSPWMVQVVITTPEILMTADYTELTAVPWEFLVVDEAHRLVRLLIPLKCVKTPR